MSDTLTPADQISNSIDADLEEAHQKLADLSNTADRMTEILSENSIPRIRNNIRMHSITICAIFALVISLLAANLFLISTVTQMTTVFTEKTHLLEQRQITMIEQMHQLTVSTQCFP